MKALIGKNTTRIIFSNNGIWDYVDVGYNVELISLTTSSPDFFKYLSLMRDAQVEHYVNNCGEPYTDIIEGRVYDIDPNKEVELQDSYNVLELDQNKDVVKKTVFYRVPTSIINN